MKAFAVSILVAFGLFAGWWVIASNYDYDALAGTYVFNDGGVSSTLQLNKDKTFHQEVIANNVRKEANGSWRRVGEGGVNFSIEFLKLPGSRTFFEEFGKGYGGIEDQEYFGHFEKILGVYPILKINANPPGPTFHRVLFR
jgi:hypothetical protein